MKKILAQYGAVIAAYKLYALKRGSARFSGKPQTPCLNNSSAAMDYSSALPARFQVHSTATEISSV